MNHMNNKKCLRLHLGCGAKILKGWDNVDIFYDSPDVIKGDISKLDTYKSNSVDLIYAAHVLEHFHKDTYRGVLELWHSKLKPGGTLRLAVPDFEQVCIQYLEKRNIAEISGLTLGGQKNPYDFHGMIFDEPLLRHVLTVIGFIDIQRYDWRTLEHRDVDDFSQAYLPHMDKDNGRLMSLNLEAKKDIK